MRRQQLGFGWGKGRRVIKTIIAGEALTRALEKQQRFVDEHVHQTRTVVDALQTAPHGRRRPLTFRMAKARVPIDGHEPT